MKTEFLYQVIDEIEESYIEEAIKMQQNRKKDKPYLKLFLSAAAAAAVIFLFGSIFPQTNDGKQNPVTNYFPSEMKEHTFSLVVYAKESSKNTTSQILENSHEYTLSTEHGNVANKFYRLVSMDSISENIGQQTLPSDEEIMGYGFNVKIEVEGIESIILFFHDNQADFRFYTELLFVVFCLERSVGNCEKEVFVNKNIGSNHNDSLEYCNNFFFGNCVYSNRWQLLSESCRKRGEYDY